MLLSQERPGAERGEENNRMIRAVIRFEDNMVMTFDSRGDRMPQYYGRYEDVKDSILKTAPPDAVFAHAFTDSRGMKKVPREEW